MIGRIAAVAIAGLVAIWAIVRLAYEPVHCDARITELTARTDVAAQTASDYERLVRIRRNLQDLDPLRESCPNAVRVPMLIGSNLEMAGRLDDALRSYREALTIEQRPEIHVAIASVLIQTGHVDEAIESYVIAVRFAPHLLKTVPPGVKDQVTERLAAIR